MKYIICFLFLLCSPNFLLANTINNKVLQETSLQERGAGMRSKFFIDLYEAKFFATPSVSKNDILSDTGEIAVSLEIVSSLITSDKMEEATREGFVKSLQGEATFSGEIENFIAVFKDEIIEGDLFTFYANDVEITIYKNSKELKTFATPGFRKALFGIWLGEDPVSKGLKKEMLGK